jgi:hypothetical protein
MRFHQVQMSGEVSQDVALFVLTPGIWDRFESPDVTIYLCSYYEKGY